MRAPNEFYKDKEIERAKGRECGWVISKPGKDLFGYDIQRGAYVIWQPYSSKEGMHIGKVLDVHINSKYSDEIKILTADNRTIFRCGYELVLLLQNRMTFESNLDE